MIRILSWVPHAIGRRGEKIKKLVEKKGERMYTYPVTHLFNVEKSQWIWI